MDKTKILVVDDESRMRKLVKDFLVRQGYTVLEAADGMEAMDYFYEDKDIALIILDVMMPKMDGYEFVKQFRLMNKTTPILMLTAKKEWEDKKNGFAIGIDDYMTKPVHYEELQWRVRALLRRSQIHLEKKITIGDLIIREDDNTVSCGEERITLPKKEFDLLFKLLSYPKKVFTTTQLLDDIWGYETDSDETTVRTHINRLRKRFASYQEFEIVTVRGLGYRAERSSGQS